MNIYTETENIKEDIYSIKDFLMHDGDISEKKEINESSKNSYTITKFILQHYNNKDKSELLNFIDSLFENIQKSIYKYDAPYVYLSDYAFSIINSDYYIYIMVYMVNELIHSIQIEVGESNTVEDTKKEIKIHFDKEMKEVYTPILNKIMDNKCKAEIGDFFNKMPTCKRNKNLNSLLNKI